MDHQAFKGTLLLLQNRTKRDPESYYDEFRGQREHFDAMMSAIESGADSSAGYSNPQFISVMNYVCHVSHCYPKDCQAIAARLIQILQKHKTTMDADTRMAFVQNLMLLRSKNLVSPETTLPLFFDLLLLRDKPLRKLILSHIVGDIRRVNMPGHKNGAQTNKSVQNYLFSVIKDDDAVQARRAMLVMIDLYRRQIWGDEKTVQVLTSCCFSRHAPIIRTALRFFLMQMPKVTSVDDTDSDEEEEKDPGRDISKLKQKLKVKKKTKKRQSILDRAVKSKVRKYDKEEKEEEAMAKAFVDPVRLLRDPQQFTEQLFGRLQRTSERFEVRILFLSVIARVIGEHQIVMLPLYSFLERYMEPTQLHATQLLALSTACVHSMIPPDAVEPLIKAIANRFVNDRSEPDSITIGINTIREICKRQPLAMNAPLLSDLVEYKGQRGDKGVVMAARALIQLYRDVYPDLLPAKYQGSSASALARKATRAATDDTLGTTTDSANRPMFGAPKPLVSIPGMELLLEYYQKKNEEAKGESSSSDDDDDSDDDSEFEWVTDSEEGLGDDFETDSEGSIDDDEEDDEDLDSDDEANIVKTRNADAKNLKRLKGRLLADDEPPMLVPVGGAAAGEKRSREDDEVSDDLDDLDDDEEDEEDFDEEDEEWDEEDDESDDEATEKAAAEKKDAKKKKEAAIAAASGLVAVGSNPKSMRASSAANSDASANAPRWMKEDIRGNSSTSTAAGTNISTLSKIVRERLRNDASMADAASVASATNVNLASVTLFSDEDFDRLRRLRQHSAWDGQRNKDRDERLKKKEKLIHGVDSLSASDIEAFTVRKRENDKEDKIAKTIEMRASKQSFHAGKKKKSKLNATHTEHAKRGKLFTMTKRSRRVGAKLKLSHEDKNKRDKDNKSGAVKFRINRGWKA